MNSIQNCEANVDFEKIIQNKNGACTSVTIYVICVQLCPCRCYNDRNRHPQGTPRVCPRESGAEPGVSHYVQLYANFCMYTIISEKLCFSLFL